MAGEAYYDENGVRHFHDPNWMSMGGRCSAGHQGRQRVLDPCPAPSCTYGKNQDPPVWTDPAEQGPEK